MKLSKLIFAAAALTFAATCAQARLDVYIPLGGATTGPGNTAFIDLASLIGGVDYDVYCQIDSHHISGSSMGYIKIYVGDGAEKSAKYFMNDSLIAGNKQTTIDAMSSNVLRAYKMTLHASYIAIQNLDDKDTITISHCNAWPTITDELAK